VIAGGGIVVLQLQAGPPTDQAAPATVGIVRDFAHPLLELIRLLREASEIEHALMVQYLYSMFSVSTAYPKLRGFALASPHLSEWPDELTAILEEGEHGHFEFFKSVFLGTHQGFHGMHDPWSLAPTDPAHPSVPLGANPSAVPGHPRELPDDHGQRPLAWSADLHYWLVLMLLDVSYRIGAPEAGEQAQQHRVSGLLPLVAPATA
jgi:hypothetical protein